jgi:hypothetical protein
LGSDWRDINKDGQLDLINSKATHKAFDEIMENNPFALQIEHWK